MVLTILTAIIFVVSQFLGFNEIISQGYYFTGPESSVTTSYVYILVFLHLAHLFAGMIVLTVVITKFNKQRYEKQLKRTERRKDNIKEEKKKYIKTKI